MFFFKLKESQILSFIFYFLSAALAIRLSFYFNDSARYIPLRVTVFVIPVVFLIHVYFNGVTTSKKMLLTTLCSSFIFIIFIFIWVVNNLGDNAVGKVIDFIYPLCVFILISYFCNKISVKSVIYGGQIFVLVSLVLLLIETFIRFMYPEYAVKGDGNAYLDSLKRDSFYIFKFGSIMYLDSNYVALHALVAFSLSFFVFEDSKRILISLLLAIVIAMALSRSVYISFLLLPMLYFFKKQSLYVKFYLLVFIFPLIIFLLFYLIYGGGVEDGSLDTKLGIFKVFFSKVMDVENLTFYWGNGFDVGGYLYSFEAGKYAHAMMPLIIGELGLIGFMVYSGLLFYAYVKIGYESLYIIVPMLVSGLSLIYPYDTMYLYSLLILFFIKKRLKVNFH